MLEAYDKVFKEYSLEEVENSYLDILVEQDDYVLDENLEYSEYKERKTLTKQAKENGIHSYLGFILSCIDALEKFNINTFEIRNKLREFKLESYDPSFVEKLLLHFFYTRFDWNLFLYCRNCC